MLIRCGYEMSSAAGSHIRGVPAPPSRRSCSRHQGPGRAASSRHTAMTEATTSAKPANIGNVRRSPRSAHPNPTAMIGLTKV